MMQNRFSRALARLAGFVFGVVSAARSFALP